jgi:pyruvate,water dikinase
MRILRLPDVIAKTGQNDGYGQTFSSFGNPTINDKNGVVFTADPVTGQRDRVVINAVRGLGEGLVGGYRTPDHFVLSREGSVLERELHGERAAVAEARLGDLLRDALKAEAELGYPLDLEWAIGTDDQCTGSGAPHHRWICGPDRLDDAVDPQQLTWYNIASGCRAR